MRKRKKEMIPFWGKKPEEKQKVFPYDICRFKIYSFSSEVEIAREIVWINILKKENFKKDSVNLIQTHHQINMTPDHSVSDNNSFKSHWNAKSFNMFLSL